MYKMTITHPLRLVILTLFLLIALIVIIFNLFWGTTEILLSGDFTIEDGSSANQVWSDLVDKGFLNSVMPPYYYSWKMQAANNLKSGTYQLQKGEHVSELISRFQSGNSSDRELSITYPEGFTIQQVATRSAAQGIGTVDSFMAAAQPANFIAQFPVLANIPPRRDLEGYLFPDTYRVFVDDEPADIIKRMLANFNNKFSQSLRDQLASQGRTIDQAVIMASIIEREVLSDEDMALVSGVLWQRHDDGVGLDADATVRYALNKWDQPLTVQDLASDSPYNTRKWKGLPPGPISNPGLRSIQAAVQPQPSDYYYYLSTPEGETIFSKTLEEHNINKAKYLR